MPKMTKSNLYTRTGDTGMTSLVCGQRVPKSCVRIDAYGTVDEFSATLGVVLTHSDCPVEIKSYLQKIQNILFNIGAYLATDSPQNTPASLYGLEQRDIEDLEKEIDRLDALTPPVHAFILPGGTHLSALTHLSRTVCRRAERMIFRLDNTQRVDARVLCYFNRLSDYLFILSRYFNHLSGVDELIWTK